MTAASPGDEDKPAPPPDPFATSTPTPTPSQGASGAAGLDALSDEELSALAERLFGIHTTTSSNNGQQGTSGQSGCPTSTSNKSSTLFSGKFFTFGYAVYYNSDDYQNLKKNPEKVTVGGPSSVNVVADYGAGRQKKTYAANKGGPYYVDSQSYIWAAYYVYRPDFETDPQAVQRLYQFHQERFDRRVGLSQRRRNDGDRLSYRELLTRPDSNAYTHSDTRSNGYSDADTRSDCHTDTDAYTHPDAGPESTREAHRPDRHGEFDQRLSGLGLRGERG